MEEKQRGFIQIYLLNTKEYLSRFLKFISKIEYENGLMERAIVLGAVEEGNPCGVLIAREEEGIYIISWIYVGKEHRRKGVASVLLRTFLDASILQGWFYSVTTVFYDNEALVELLKKAGFSFQTPKDGIQIWNTDVKRLMKIPTFHPALGKNTSVESMIEVSEKKLNTFFQKLVQNGIYPPIPLPFHKEDYVEQSVVYLDEGNIRGIFLINYAKDVLSVPWVYATSGNIRCLPAMIDAVVSGIANTYHPTTEFVIATTNTKAQSVTGKLLGESKEQKIVYAEYLLTAK